MRRRMLAIAWLWLAVLPLTAFPLAPAAQAEARAQLPHLPHGDCKRLTRQIGHYARVADMARERDNELWEQHTMAHIGRLSERRQQLCPQYAQRPAGEQLLKMLKNAAKIAMTLFTWGLI